MIVLCVMSANEIRIPQIPMTTAHTEKGESRE